MVDVVIIMPRGETIIARLKSVYDHPSVAGCYALFVERTAGKDMTSTEVATALMTAINDGLTDDVQDEVRFAVFVAARDLIGVVINDPVFAVEVRLIFFKMLSDPTSPW